MFNEFFSQATEEPTEIPVAPAEPEAEAVVETPAEAVVETVAEPASEAAVEAAADAAVVCQPLSTTVNHTSHRLFIYF